MAPLPQRRLIPTAPFEEVGLDCMGHFLVKLNGRADHKVWAVVFTCMVSRAVHVEVLFKMDTEAMINAIRKVKRILLKFPNSPKNILIVY